MRYVSSCRAIGVSVVFLAIASCDDTTSLTDRVVAGPTIVVGQGTAHTELKLNKAGDPISFDVVFSESVLTGLPAGMTTFELSAPAEVTTTPYNHVTLNWNPGGHPPPGIYDKPHFDVHYYMITPAQRAAIAPSDPQFGVKAVLQPAAEFIPPTYVGDPMAIPNMGTHWGSTTAPERNGQPFTHALIYGFYDAKMIFLEPMFTVAFLQTHPNVTTSIAVPARYPVPGRYPTRYGIKYDSTLHEYRISASDFVARN